MAGATDYYERNRSRPPNKRLVAKEQAKAFILSHKDWSRASLNEHCLWCYESMGLTRADLNQLLVSYYD
jgi:hypothetical protein